MSDEHSVTEYNLTELTTARDPRKLVADLCAITAERDALLAWRESALAVEAEWDAQKVAAMLGGHLGESCRKVVAEKVPELIAERDALRAALEEVCRCSKCQGSGSLTANSVFGPNSKVQCYICEGTGRDYHGSELAKKLLDGKP